MKEIMKMSENDAIHVALAFGDPDGTYARHAAVTLASVFANCRGRAVVAHVLHDATLTQRNKAALLELARRYGQTVAFHDAEEYLRKPELSALKLTLQGFRGTMYRFLMPDLLDASRAVYLDCDVIVNMDIGGLWTQDLRGCAVGAVRDIIALEYSKGHKIPWSLKKAWSLWDIAPENYFNAGVLLMDMDKIRSRYRLMDSVRYFFDEYGACATLLDQDFLNWLFAEDTLLLDGRFNRIDASGAREDTVGGSIWHLTGLQSIKPWNSYTRPFVDDLYWRYLRQTPYCEDDDELIAAMLRGMASSPLMHRHSADCLGRLGRQIRENLFRPRLKVPLILLKLLKKRFFRGKFREDRR